MPDGVADEEDAAGAEVERFTEPLKATRRRSLPERASQSQLRVLVARATSESAESATR